MKHPVLEFCGTHIGSTPLLYIRRTTNETSGVRALWDSYRIEFTPLQRHIRFQTRSYHKTRYTTHRIHPAAIAVINHRSDFVLNASFISMESRRMKA